ncbi:poly-gamma-glutamate biosynthesis protein PgsC [Cetobacterium sp.]|uniref:poly-gamma-glutamate biosynthesis protein PgsC n=1 Tax=Cetobacterium sp. TaxID=2071632 RepID=UPI002FCB9CDF
MNETVVVLGVILSIIFYEVSEMSPGGMIVPGYFALFSNDPKRILMTIAISIGVLFLVKILENYVVLFGRRKFAIYIVLVFILKKIFGNMNLEILIGAEIIGILIPAILAQDFEKNGLKKTIPALLILTIVIKSICVLAEGML